MDVFIKVCSGVLSSTMGAGWFRGIRGEGRIQGPGGGAGYAEPGFPAAREVGDRVR